ncbi:MAG: hypothetical protein AAFX44_02785 [Pseudomonadota bacterium]
MTPTVTDEQRRRNRATAVWLGVVAVGFFMAFVVAVDARNGWQFLSGFLQ